MTINKTPFRAHPGARGRQDPPADQRVVRCNNRSKATAGAFGETEARPEAVRVKARSARGQRPFVIVNSPYF